MGGVIKLDRNPVEVMYVMIINIRNTKLQNTITPTSSYN